MKKTDIVLVCLLIVALVVTFSKKIQNSLKGHLGFSKPNYPDEISNRIFIQAKKRGLSDRLAALMVAWSKWETGNYSSHFVTDNRNLFGYTYDKNSKYQTGYNGSNPKAGRFATYATLEDSVNENVDWMNRRVKKQDRGTWPSLEDITDPIEFARLLMQSKYSDDSYLVYGQGIRTHLGNS